MPGYTRFQRNSRTISLKTLKQQRPRTALKVVPYWRPQTRADCESMPRPCPYVSCRYHLYLDVTPYGSIQLNFPEKEPHEMEESCALDAAETGGMTLSEVGERMDVTRERVRQIEASVVPRFRALLKIWQVD